VRKLLISGLQQEYGARLLETLVTSAVLTLPSYTYTDIGRVSLPHFASYIGKLQATEEAVSPQKRTSSTSKNEIFARIQIH
jgi:hypothetical protein